jgi:hypothetical protein
MDAVITQPFRDFGGRKYIFLKTHDVVLQVKIPFRYNRVMCTVHGHIPIQDFKAGQHVRATIEYKKWEGQDWPVLKDIELL